MKITQEKLPASQVGLEIEVPSDMSQQTYERVIQQFTRSLNIPGFRKGKVPRQVLLQRLGSIQIKQAVLEELIQDSFKHALEETKVAAIGTPELKTSFDELVAQYEPGKAFTFSAAVDIQPEVVLKQYKGFEVKAEEVSYESTKIDSVLEDYRLRVATLVPIEDRTAQRGDVAIIDYHGRLTNADTSSDPNAGNFQGNEAQDFQVELEEGRFIEGFIDGIIGMAVGEAKEIVVPFPADYPLAEVAGQDATFSITLKELKGKELPDLDDDFAQDISEFETLAELRASLESRYQTEAEEKTRQNKEEAIVAALLEHVEVELPETLIRQEVDYLITQTAMRLQEQGMDIKQLFTPETVPRFREQSRDNAILSLKRSLALAEIAKQESLSVDSAAVQAKIAEIKQSSQGQDLDESRLQDIVESEQLTAQVLSWLLENSTVELLPPGSLSAAASEEVVLPESENTPDPASVAVAPDAEPAADAQSTEATDEQTTEATSEASQVNKKTPAKGRKKTTKKIDEA